MNSRVPLSDSAGDDAVDPARFIASSKRKLPAAMSLEASANGKRDVPLADVSGDSVALSNPGSRRNHELTLSETDGV
jgi:hypothetical protein